VAGPEAHVRASPFVELKRLAGLDAAQRAQFAELESDPNFYGLFIPKPPLTTNLKAVERETAELFLSLAIPSRVLVDDHIIDLVLDGVLEIESDGEFVCGADAVSILCDPISSTATRGLSRDALLHAQDLELSDARELTFALYLYNRIPLTPFWKARFPNPAAILAHLGADRLAGHWAAGRHDHWLSWSRTTSHDASAVTYKLYVSPRPERIRDAFDAVVRVLAEVPETAFKIGDSAAGLLRPDKLVLYFTTREQLDEVADALRRELSGCDAHGVPFTAGLDDSGLLSWGIDPPDNDRPLRWLDSESWRLWIAQRLGAALSVAALARSASAIEPWRFAVERVRRAGVDVDTWTPSPRLWSRA